MENILRECAERLLSAEEGIPLSPGNTVPLRANGISSQSQPAQISPEDKENNCSNCDKSTKFALLGF